MDCSKRNAIEGGKNKSDYKAASRITYHLISMQNPFHVSRLNHKQKSFNDHNYFEQVSVYEPTWGLFDKDEILLYQINDL